MRFPPLTFLLLLSLLIMGCSSADNVASNAANRNADANSANSAKDSVDDLGMMIKLPFEPEEATWKEIPPGKLTAVLLYSNEDAEKFASHLAAQAQPKPDTVSAEDWFPTELLSQSDLGGESVLKGQSYNAGDLLQPPYTQGKVTRIADSNYFVVQVTSK